jgi:hypothetical protein
VRAGGGGQPRRGRRGGFSQFAPTARWEAQLAKLEAYKAVHGDCGVPWNWAEDPQLGIWVSAGALDTASPNFMGLASLGLAIGIFCDFLCSVLLLNAILGIDFLGRALSRPQVSAQRTRKRALDRGEPSNGMTAARAAKLDALGFAWGVSAAEISVEQRNRARDDTRWEVQLAKLKAYKAVRGDCNVPRRWAEDDQLGRWVSAQVRKMPSLPRSWAKLQPLIAVFPQECMGQLASSGPT